MSVLRLAVRSAVACHRFAWHVALYWWGVRDIDRQAEADALCAPVWAYERERGIDQSDWCP